MSTSSPSTPTDGTPDLDAVVPPRDDIARYLPAGTPVVVALSDNATLKSLGFPATSTIYNMIAAGRLRAFKVGKSSYVFTADIAVAIRREPMPPLRRASPRRLNPAA